jgi:hypothetical protein
VEVRCKGVRCIDEVVDVRMFCSLVREKQQEEEEDRDIYSRGKRCRGEFMQFNVTPDRDVGDLDDLHGIEPACHVFVPGRNSNILEPQFIKDSGWTEETWSWASTIMIFGLLNMF